jgi:flagellar protein FliJ
VLAAAQQKIQAVRVQIQQMKERIFTENRALGARELVGRLDMQFIAHEKRYVGNLHLKIALAMQELSALEKRHVLARAELLEAARARKVIEKLREKRQARWRAEQDRKEAAIMDEIGTQLAIRRALEQAS